MPRVSIIIPCFNKGEYLDGSLSSALSQTFRETEAIVVNDGSTDPFTLKKPSEISDPRVRVIHTPQSGLPAAMNNGIREASGEYILPLDCGDRISPEYVELAVRELDKDKAVGIVYSDAGRFGANTGIMEMPEYSRDTMLVRNLIHPSAFFRKADWERAGGYNSNMVYGWEDWDLWLSLIALGAGV
ncbi:MAG: glycosyltransferase family 2 protein, partial [Deltaproteobacteria bacterium]|nr:glycosyltransferase family 2 protein [Deltaproteobacteria bacterium]